MKPFFVYVLKCADGSYYVGHTDTLEQRVAKHDAGAIPGCYTTSRRPVQLVWSQETATRDEALAAERQIKGWSREKKAALVRGDWDAIKRLAWGTRNPMPDQDGLLRPFRDEASKVGLSTHPSIPQGERSVVGERGVTGELGVVGERGVTGELGVVGERRVTGELGVTGERGAGGLVQSESGAEGCPSIPQGERGVVDQGKRGVVDQGKRGVVDQGERGVVDQGERPAMNQGEGGIDAGDVGERAIGATLQSPVRPEVSKDGRPEAERIVQGSRRSLAKAITLVESTRADHRAQADALLEGLMPHTGRSLRVGISGVPGVGKSTFIEALGLHLVDAGSRVAVLTVDPSSSLSGGSILGDKTRMERLSVHPWAFIRPSPTSGALGGVAEHTREALLLCEAAGFDVVIVETVGVGQSETAVADMTDLFVLMQLPNAGDDLQAIKRGVMELADMVVINKADIDDGAATRAQAQISSALRVFGFHGRSEHHAAPVLKTSATRGEGLADFWCALLEEAKRRRESGAFEARRAAQREAWLWDIVHARLMDDFKRHAGVRQALGPMLASVKLSRSAPTVAARTLLNLFEKT